MARLPEEEPEPNPIPFPNPTPTPMPTQANPPTWLLGVWDGQGRELTVNPNGSLFVTVGSSRYDGIYQNDGTILLNGDTSTVAQTSTGIVTQNRRSGEISEYLHPVTTPTQPVEPPATSTPIPPTSTTQPVNTPISTTNPTTGTITTQYPDGTVTVTDPKTGQTQTVVQGTSNTILDFVKQNPLLVAGGAALVAYLILGE